MRVDHEFSALITIDLFRILALTRSQAVIYRIDQLTIKFEIIAFVDRFLCREHCQLVSLAHSLFHSIFQKDR